MNFSRLALTVEGRFRPEEARPRSCLPFPTVVGRSQQAQGDRIEKSKIGRHAHRRKEWCDSRIRKQESEGLTDRALEAEEFWK